VPDHDCAKEIFSNRRNNARGVDLNILPWAESLGHLPPEPTAITIGVFDGVHRGHQYLLRTLRESAALKGLTPAVLTFTNHPSSILRPEAKLELLVPIADRIQLLHDEGIDFVLPIEFTYDLSLWSHNDFVSCLHADLGMQHLLVGPDFALGHQRKGTVPVLTEIGSLIGFSVETAEPFLIDGSDVSSTRVRESLSCGNVELARVLLGRPFSIQAIVERGKGRGGPLLGFPTANLPIPKSQAIPTDGIYAAWAHSNETRYPAAVSIGRNPTFQPDGPRVIEVHLLSFQGDLYGNSLRVEFVAHLRNHAYFSSVEQLVQQMHQDIADTNTILSPTSSIRS
jgi:riboflavin kinase/FMN adenylyltransferase